MTYHYCRCAVCRRNDRHWLLDPEAWRSVGPPLVFCGFLAALYLAVVLLFI